MNTDDPCGPELNEPEGKRFHWRGLTSLTVTTGFLVLAVTGVVLYFTPQGRVANWTGWTFLGLEKEQWSAIHTTAAIVFVVSSLFHVYFNWRLLVNYIVMKRKLHLKREMAAALAIVFVVAAGTLLGVPPFSTVVEVNDRIKLYWENRNVQAPYPHAEDSVLQEFCTRSGLSVDQVTERLNTAGITVRDPATETIRDLAEARGITPLELFSRILPERSVSGGGSGMGRLTVQDFCEQQGLSLEKALELLHHEGFEAQETSTLKTLAGQKGMKPMQLKGILEQAVK